MEEERVQDADGRNNQYFFIFSSLCGDRFEKEESSDVAAVGRKSRSSFDQFVEYQAESISAISGGCSGNSSGDNKLDTREAVGYGDVWIITLLGIYLGIWDTVTLVCIAFFFSSIAAVGCLVWKKFRRDTRIPFVPFLTAAYVGVVFL